MMGEYWKQLKSVGGHGCKVQVMLHRGRVLRLRWWNPEKQGMDSKPAKLQVPDGATGAEKLRIREAAIQEAKELSGSLLAGTQADAAGILTLAALFDRYEEKRSKHKKGSQPAEDRRRILVWETVLGADRDVRTIGPADLDDFVRDRKAGLIVLPDRGKKAPGLKKQVSDGTIGSDIVFLNAVFNWAHRTRLGDGRRLLIENPIDDYQRPKAKNPRQVVASYDRYLLVREHADVVDPQKLFGAFMHLVEDLGWRVSAIRQLRREDVDGRRLKSTPHGRIRKAGEFDKEGVEMWVPLSAEARRVLDRIPVLAGWLFPSPKKPAKPWSRHHARDLLDRAEKAAGLDPLEGADFHAYRRKWATERKHLPTKDVAHAGGWKDLRTLERAYQQVDAETLLAVVTEKRKLREAK